MTLEKKPFVNYTLEQDKKESATEVISLKLNLEERALIDRLKECTNYGQDAKIIKAGLVVLEKVILGTFGADLFKKFTSTDRRKPIIETRKEIQT